MARTKTTSSNPADHTSPAARTHSPPPNAAATDDSDQSPLNQTPLRIVLQDVIIPAFDTHKPSKPKTSKIPIIKSKPKQTRRSQ